MKQKSETYWLLEASASKAIWHMAIPMMLGMSVNMIYNITDTFFIGRLNDTAALAAMTLLVPVTTILMAVGNLFGTGGSTLFSRLLGSDDTEKTKQCSATTFVLSVASGVLCAILIVAFSNKIALLLGADTATLPYVQRYMLYYGLGSPFIVANFTLEQLIRGEGESVQSMIGMLLSVCTNIILDPVMMFGLHLGIGGAAIATVIGNVAAVVYYVLCIQREGKQLSVQPRFFKLEQAMLKPIFSVGISAMLLDILLVISSLMFNYYAMQYGDYVLTGFGISQKLVQIVDLVGMGLYMGVIPLIAAAYGAQNTVRVRESIGKTALYLALLITALVTVLFLCRNSLIGCFSQDSEVLQTGKFILTVQLCSSFFAAGSGLLTSIFQAKGKGTPAIVMSIARGLILIPALVIGNYFWQLNGVIFSLLAAEAVSCVTGLGLYAADKVRHTTTILSE